MKSSLKAAVYKYLNARNVRCSTLRWRWWLWFSEPAHLMRMAWAAAAPAVDSTARPASESGTDYRGKIVTDTGVELWKASLKAVAYRYLNARNAKVLYITVALVALVLGAGALMRMVSAAAALVDDSFQAYPRPGWQSHKGVRQHIGGQSGESIATLWISF